MQKLRILVYRDDPKFAQEYNSEVLRKILVDSGHAVTMRIRSTRITGGIALDSILDDRSLQDFDEIWFLLAAKDDALALEDRECQALLKWMDNGGGVLLAGDHAEEVDGKPDYVGLGAPVGSKIPRAGALREWGKDGPDQTKRVFSTTGHDPPPQKDPDPDRDTTPQRLLLPRIDHGQVHQIFYGDTEDVLDRLPDHAHEGMVLAPEPTGPDWPPNPPIPQVIAKSVCWSTGKTFDSMVAWEPKGRYGRIVADTSFHHYVDDNLQRLGEGNRHWSKIRRFYIKLAAWLAPPRWRVLHIKEALRWVVAHAGLEPASLGTDIPLIRTLLAARLPWQSLREVDMYLADHYRAHRHLAEMPEFADQLLAEYLRELAGLDGGGADDHTGDHANAESSPDRSALVVERALKRYGDALRERLDRLTKLARV